LGSHEELVHNLLGNECEKVTRKAKKKSVPNRTHERKKGLAKDDTSSHQRKGKARRGHVSLECARPTFTKTCGKRHGDTGGKCKGEGLKRDWSHALATNRGDRSG